MKNFVRGAGVNIAITFKDDTGAIVNPTGANVTISFVPKNNTDVSPQRSFVTYAMTAPGAGQTAWTYNWDSSVAEPGAIYGNAVTTTVNQPVSSVDFSFRLTANRANKELAGDDYSCDGYQ